MRHSLWTGVTAVSRFLYVEGQVSGAEVNKTNSRDVPLQSTFAKKQ